MTSVNPFSAALAQSQAAAAGDAKSAAGFQASAKASEGEVKEAFQQFVGETFFGMMLKQMRQGVEKNPYFHGGAGEEVFQGQLDQVIVEKVSKASADSFSEPMYELFMARRG